MKKFRVWDKKLNKYIELNPFIALGNGDYILEQWAGVYDRNGKEIYEGDIVNYKGVVGKISQWANAYVVSSPSSVCFEDSLTFMQHGHIIGNVNETAF